MSDPRFCAECGYPQGTTRRLVLWYVGPAARMAAHICPSCYAAFEAKGRCMSALPNIWAQGGAQRQHELNKRASEPLVRPIVRM
jgi:hypothetical protein